MATLGNPKIWVPYINPKDCSQGFCSLSCPQLCYLVFPPPPPSSFSFPLETSPSSPTFSPLVITIIGVLASAFLLVSYYAILSKYCGNSEPSRRVENQQPTLDDDEVEHDDQSNNPSQHEAWVIRTTGLDEALIKSITLVSYKKGDGIVGSGDCSVCLGEFQEDESLRLLPKCSHAFHVVCIDTWLRSHSNCPLCRAAIFSTTSRTPPQLPPPLVVESNNHHHPPQDHGPSMQTNEENRTGDQEEASGRNLPKNPFRASSDLGLHGGLEGHAIRRSISMDHCHETRLSISDILRLNSKEATAGQSSKDSDGGGSFSNEISANGMFNCVMNSVGLKRSFSSGRFFFSKHGRGRNGVMPL